MDWGRDIRVIDSHRKRRTAGAEETLGEPAKVTKRCRGIERVWVSKMEARRTRGPHHRQDTGCRVACLSQDLACLSLICHQDTLPCHWLCFFKLKIRT